MYDFESIHLDQLTTIHGGQVADTQSAPCTTVIHNSCNAAFSCATINGSVVTGGSGSGPTIVDHADTKTTKTNTPHGISIGGITLPSLPFGIGS